MEPFCNILDTNFDYVYITQPLAFIVPFLMSG